MRLSLIPVNEGSSFVLALAAHLRQERPDRQTVPLQSTGVRPANFLAYGVHVGLKVRDGVLGRVRSLCGVLPALFDPGVSVKVCVL